MSDNGKGVEVSARARIGDWLFRQGERWRVAHVPGGIGPRMAALLKSIALGVMRPDDLCDFGFMRYSKEADVWGQDEVMQTGLLPQEERLQAALANQSGRILILGVGCGREALPLARMGYRVTGLDYVAEMVDQAVEHARRNGIDMTGMAQDVRRVDLPAESFEVIWVSTWLYSYLPSRRERVAILGKLREALVPGGEVVCQYAFNALARPAKWMATATRAAAALTRGYLDCDPLDRLTIEHSFLHTFATQEAAREEFVEAGFQVTFTDLRSDGLAGAAILLNAPPDAQPKEDSR